MSPIQRLRFLLGLSNSAQIARRYFVTNGFDGALTMLGLITGFRLSQYVDLQTVLWACMGTAIALATSGISSAYISESAERRKALKDLEDAMAGESLSESSHARAAQVAALFIALVNGGAPLLLAIFIALPIWLELQGIGLGAPALDSAIVIAFIEIGLMGAFLGKVSGQAWWWMSIRTLLVAAVTATIIFALGA